MSEASSPCGWSAACDALVAAAAAGDDVPAAEAFLREAPGAIAARVRGGGSV